MNGSFGYYAGYTYDAAGRALSVLDGDGPVVQLGYDAQGRRQTPDGGVGAVTSRTSYSYDAASRLSSLGIDLGGTGADQSLGFGYNHASQIVTRTSSNDAYASNTAYDVSRSYAVNGLNQYVSAGPKTFAYDANGNLTSDGLSSFVYDAENRLVSASGAKTATLSYDPLGRLWQVSGPDGTARFDYDGDHRVWERDAAGNSLRAYAFGPGTDEPLIWYELVGGWTRRYLRADHQGSIVAVADTAGNPVAVNAYDSWGIPNTGNQGKFGYTGQAWLSELGMWYYKARIYSPTLGRFLQTDPIGYEDQVNLYAYVGNDPINKNDPTGMYECKTKADCKVAQEGISQIKAARNFYASSEIGSRVPRASLAAAALDKVLGSLGSKGDGGINIQEGAPRDGANGEYRRESNLIVMSSSQIAKTGGRIGETLAHEVQHYRQRDEGLGRYAGEMRPLMMGLLVARAPGGSVNYDVTARGYVRGRFSGYCKFPPRFCSPEFEKAWNAESKKPF